MALTEEDLSKIIEEGIDPDNPGKYADLLNELQGNILKSHGRDHAVHLFLKFTALAQEAKEWLQTFAQAYVTSAAKQAQQTKSYKRSKKLGVKASSTTTTFVNLFLSRKGYQYLDTGFKVPRDDFFKYGMKAKEVKDYLGDVSHKEWDQGLQDEIHALILIADDDSERLKTLVEELTPCLSSVAEIVQQETGFILRNDSDQVIEHFGFADGVSQPLFMKSDVDKAKDKDDFDQWDPRAPLNVVLAKDPNGKTEDSYGSYLVYRKLEQDVEAFRAAEAKLAAKLGIDSELAGAYIVGRFKDGTPVTLSEQPTETTTNNFNYNNDPTNFGLDPKPSKCPFHAHIRKTNPRGDTSRVHSAPHPETELERERGHRIARRGISYGEQDPNLAPKTGSGLLFLCFQGEIVGQFAFIQNAWANENKFVKVNVGNDPIIGVTGDGEADPAIAGNRQWLKKWGETDSEAERDLLEPEPPFKVWIHLKGGESRLCHPS
ncbi:MAG: peroxidase [Merismopedia sp. SIO2A8]|nr:peroxidase [Merismopedia sp. SIO2A8]